MPSTHIASHSIASISIAHEVLTSPVDVPGADLRMIALHTLMICECLMREYTMDHFSNEEVDLVSDTFLECLDFLHGEDQS